MNRPILVILGVLFLFVIITVVVIILTNKKSHSKTGCQPKCPSGYKCNKENRCIPETGLGCHPACTSGQICDKKTNTCVPVPCDPECVPPSVCKNGTCSGKVSCQSSRDCQSHEVCINPGELNSFCTQCSTSDDCQYLQHDKICINGGTTDSKCVNCAGDADCPYFKGGLQKCVKNSCEIQNAWCEHGTAHQDPTDPNKATCVCQDYSQPFYYIPYALGPEQKCTRERAVLKYGDSIKVLIFFTPDNFSDPIPLYTGRGWLCSTTNGRVMTFSGVSGNGKPPPPGSTAITLILKSPLGKLDGTPINYGDLVVLSNVGSCIESVYVNPKDPDGCIYPSNVIQYGVGNQSAGCHSGSVSVGDQIISFLKVIKETCPSYASDQPYYTDNIVRYGDIAYISDANHNNYFIGMAPPPGTSFHNWYEKCITESCNFMLQSSQYVAAGVDFCGGGCSSGMGPPGLFDKRTNTFPAIYQIFDTNGDIKWD